MKAQLLNYYRNLRHRKTRLLSRTAGVLSLFLLVSGCALNQVQTVQTTAQKQAIDTESTTRSGQTGLLALVANMQAGETGNYDGMAVEAGAPFFAASGRICKHITLRDQTRAGMVHTRLACHAEHGWVFAADVFSSEPRGD